MEGQSHNPSCAAFLQAEAMGVWHLEGGMCSSWWVRRLLYVCTWCLESILTSGGEKYVSMLLFELDFQDQILQNYITVYPHLGLMTNCCYAPFVTVFWKSCASHYSSSFLHNFSLTFTLFIQVQIPFCIERRETKPYNTNLNFVSCHFQGQAWTLKLKRGTLCTFNIREHSFAHWRQNNKTDKDATETV